MTILLLLAGLALLVAGGELLVRGAVSVAAGLGMSPLLIGLVIVGFGTSTPELVTSVEAALVDAPGVAVGNVFGSNVCNVLLILGLIALIRPVPADRGALARDGTVLALATAAAVAVAFHGEIGRPVGLAFVAALALWVALAAVLERRAVAARVAGLAEGVEIAPPPGPANLLRAALFVAAGLAGLMIGARIFVDNAVRLAAALGVSETVIGLTVVAVGTSLPELAASVIAVVRGRSDIGFGNVLGSNVYNILGILGVTALVKPVPIPPEMLAVDVWVMAATTAVLIVTALTAGRVSRAEGALMLAAYAGYVGWLAASAGAG